MKRIAEAGGPLVTAMIQCPTPEECIHRIHDSLKAGAEALGVQLCQLKREYRTPEHLKAIFDACGDRVIYVTSYRVGQSAGLSDEECVELLLLAGRCGATLLDVPADLFCKEENGITYDEAAVVKQKALVDEIHAMGCEALISTHHQGPSSLEEIMAIGRAQVERGTDEVKIVVKDTDIRQLPVYITALQRLAAEMGKPVLFLPSGPCGTFLRRIGIELGCCMALTVVDHGPLDTVQQPVIGEVLAIRENLHA